MTFNFSVSSAARLAGQEFYLRLHVRWVDFVHLATFHLGLVFGKMVIGIEEHLMPFIDENLSSLDLPKEVRLFIKIKLLCHS